MFPLVYVWVRQRGAWKLHPYNSNAQKLLFYHVICPFSSIWNKSYNLAIMEALQIAPRTQTKLVEASQHHYLPNNMLAAPKFNTNKVDITDSIFSLVEVRRCSLLVVLLVHNSGPHVLR